MWLFGSFGVLMPALIPESVLQAGKTKDIKEAAANGWELQVRGRVKEHLKYFVEQYMDEGTHSKIYTSPDKDYNVRFYTTREAYGEALKRMSLAIDYTKFKDTSLKFPWGKKYHDLLIRIWSASTSLAPAGGFYGPKSKRNPRGYSKARRSTYKSYYDSPLFDDRPVGSTFFDDEDEMGGVDDLPYELTRGRGKSIHELTDDELEDMFNRG